MALLPIPTPPVPIAKTDDGKVSKSWYDWFLSLQAMVKAGGGGGGAPVGATYVTLSTDATLTSERVLTAGTNISFVDGGAGGLLTVNATGGGVTDGDKTDITVSGGGATWTIDNNVVTFAKMQDIATDRLIGRDTAASGDPEEITVGGGLEFTGAGGIQRSALTGDVTATAGSNATTIAADAVTNAKLANMATATFKGRTTAGTGDPEDLTVTQATALLNAMVGANGAGGTKGLVPAPAAGDAAAGKFLKADATWAVPAGGGGGVSDGDKGDIVVSGSGTIWLIEAKLTADRTYFVRTDGNDANTGLVDSAGGAFLTINKALATVAALFFNGFTVTIQIRDGTYTTPVLLNTAWAGGPLVIQGNSATPSNVVISTTSADAFTCTIAIPAPLTLKDFKVQTVTQGSTIVHGGVGPISFSNIVFGAAPGGAHLFTKSSGAKIQAIGNYSITAGANFHYEAAFGGLIDVEGRVVTVTGTPAFVFFALSTASGSNLVVIGTTYSGATTGVRFRVQINAAILTGAGGLPTFFPGDADGAIATGGQYI